MREKIEYFLVLSLIKFAKFVPNSIVYKFFVKVSISLFYILKSRRRLAISNLSNAFKDLSEGEVKNLAKESFRSIGRTLGDCFLLINKKIELEELFEDPKKYKEIVSKEMDDNKNGILFFTAHFGNWEILTKYVAKVGFPQLIVSREGNNTLIEKNITMKFRDEHGNEFSYKDEAMSNIVRKLKKGGIVGILTDLKLNNSIVVPFFGRECYTAKTVGSLYIRYNPKIIPIFARRLKNNRYEIVVKKFPDIVFSGDKEEDIKNVTIACNQIYESIIKESPEQWFWMHNRWKMD